MNKIKQPLEEDFEREADKYYMYRVERQMEEEDEYREWCNHEQKLPAKIKVLTKKFRKTRKHYER